MFDILQELSHGKGLRRCPGWLQEVMNTFWPFLKPGISASALSCLRAFCRAFSSISTGTVTSKRMFELGIRCSVTLICPFGAPELPLLAASSEEEGFGSADPGSAPSVSASPASARPGMEGSSACIREQLLLRNGWRGGALPVCKEGRGFTS